MKRSTSCRILAFVTVLLAAPAGAAPDPAALDAGTRAEVVESLAQALASSYAVPVEGEKLAAAVRGRHATGAYDRFASPYEFAQALQADVRAAVDDKHLRVTFDNAAAAAPPPAPPGVRDGAIGKLQILPGNVGYMQVNGVPPGVTLTIDAAFAYLRNTDALIIDLRGNGGGWPETVAYYMSYLSEGAPYIVMRILGRDGEAFESRTTDLGERAYGAKKPLYVLTSSYTFSGGEEFAYDVQAFKRGLVVGDITGGGANPGAPQRLGHGFSAFIPTGLAKHPVTGTSWEGIGVQPDVPVESALALLEAHRLAVEALAAGGAHAESKEVLRAIAASIAEQKANAAAAGPRPAIERPAQFTGRYQPAGGGAPSFTVVEKEAQLVLQPSNTRPPMALEPVGGRVFHLAGLPDDFTVAFSVDADGRHRLLLQRGNATPPLLLERQ